MTPNHQSTNQPINETQVIESRLHHVLNNRVFVGIPRRTGDWVTGSDAVARRLLYFAAGDRFGLDFWGANEYGTTAWRVVICEALGAGEHGDKLPHVRPLVSVLLDINGAQRGQAFMHWLRLNNDDLFSRTPEQWNPIHHYFNRSPLVRLKGLISSTKARKNE
jgi:Protein of unknown function (DUF2840)